MGNRRFVGTVDADHNILRRGAAMVVSDRDRIGLRQCLALCQEVSSIVRDGELAVEGDLTIHGVTRKVKFAVEGPTPPAKDPWGNTRVAVSAVTKISRKDWNLNWNVALETGGWLVGDQITINIELELVKQVEAPQGAETVAA